MKVGVLGGGLVGLVVAGHAAATCEVLEADDTVGGHCRSLVRDGYSFDLGGPHILFSRNQEIIEIYAEFARVLRIERVFDIDEGREPTALLRLSDHRQSERRFSR